ncbi:Cytidylate kinase [Malonomonas rubra DSM 5091]|uniref:Cytidylate kinase n=1 Tax=Malonomonas rubra DSM 5091 TaxID=1122189 RepID=A0A1M6EXV1_MALRU|nr:cytidylate kinase-like family protein [Malonomonas rubra]SHI90226.1 Cytidylate kinase [Malonomonas rubra DSM 5091]
MANMDYWTPQLESKLHCWHRAQTMSSTQKNAPCLTIAREFGCQAYPLAEALAAKLNAENHNLPWIIVGKKLLKEVSKLSGYSVEQIEKAQDVHPTVKAVFSMFLDKHLAEETEIFQHMKPVIRSFAKRGHCIFVGHGAVMATQDMPNCTHVRLVASHEFRVKKIMESYDLTQKEATEHIEQYQQQRKEFLYRFTESDISDPKLYHLVLNNGRLPVEAMADMTLQHLPR